MSNSQSGRLGFGIILILVGSLFLLDNLNLIPFDIMYNLFRWQTILIVIGLVLLATKPNKGAGLVLLAIGVFFLLPDILHMPYFRFRLFWPVLLIFLGFMYILRQRGYSGRSSVVPDGSMDYLEDTNVFGGGEVVVTSKNFKGGKVTSIFGGSNYNLTSAKLAEGINIIDFFALFGGGTFVVPSDWNVRVEVTSVFGGFSDKRIPTKDKKEESKELYLKGFVLFGGGEIKGY